MTRGMRICWALAFMAWPSVCAAAEPVASALDGWNDRLGAGLNYQLAGNELYRFGAFFAAMLAANMAGEALRTMLAAAAARFRSMQRFVFATILDAGAKHIARGMLILGAFVGLAFLRLDFMILQNPVRSYLRLAFTVYLAMLVGQLLQYVLARLAAVFRGRNRALVATTCDSVSRSARLGAIALGMFLGTQFLFIDKEYREDAATIFRVLGTIVGAYLAWRLVDVVERWLTGFTRKTNSRLDDMLLPVVKTILRTGICFAATVKIAQDTHNDDQLTTILAGVSVGGLAVGLAAQESIKNFFGSVMIFSDRPFELGDLIRVDSQEGRVEAVGFRSTRLRTIEGHLVTIPNGDLASKTILNIAKRPHLRRQLNLRLHPSTPPMKVERAVEIVRDILADHEGMDPQNPPLVTFSDIQESALNIQATYYFPPHEGGRFSAFSERVNFEIIRRFHADEIELATQRQAAA
jgi:MscS family membrane protein